MKRESRKLKLYSLIKYGIIFAVAIVFIYIGSTNGEMDIIFRKAINLCGGCIGLE